MACFLRLLRSSVRRVSDSTAGKLLQGGDGTGAVAGRALTVRVLYPLLLCSGFAGLGYQIAWTRSLSIALGHEVVAVLAVVAAFFVGLALGGLLLNDTLRRTPVPARWYCALEVGIGLWALLISWLLPTLNESFAQWMGTDPGVLSHWSVAFGASLLMLLPATTAMGATLPAIERLGLIMEPTQKSVAGIYAANTAGAMIGALVATFFLLPSLGLAKTVAVFAAINFAIAAFVWHRAARDEPLPELSPVAWATSEAPWGTALLATLFATGMLGIGYEVLVVRVLAQVLEGTVYSFSAVLAIYLGGTAAGAALYQRYGRTHVARDRWTRTTSQLLFLAAFSCALGVACLYLTMDLYRGVFSVLGPGSITGLVAELSVAGIVFLLPTIAMGALFSHLAQSGSGEHGLGKLLGVNTLGAALAPVLFGVVVLPLIGAKLALLAICAGYLLLPLLASSRSVIPWFGAVPATIALVLLLLFSMPLRFVPESPGGEVIDYREGVIAAVAVIEEADGSRHLAVNNHFIMGGTASRFSDHRQTHLPLLLHGDARSALYLGLGTGITLQAAQYYPALSATGVELIPELPDLMPLFGVETAGGRWQQAPTIRSADARRFVTADTGRYDVVIAEVFHPSRDGAGSLYTVEHFSAVRERLAPDGLFCQWLPLFQLELDTLRTIVRSYLEVFPDAQMHLAHFSLGQPLLCLLGGAGKQKFSPDWLLQRVHERTLQQQLVALRLNSDFALFGGYLGGPEALARFAGPGRLNTDDSAFVAYQAPAFVYGEPDLPAERLVRLVESMRENRGSLLDPRFLGSEFDERLKRYWQARDVFLSAGVGIRPTGDIRALLREVREPLLRAARISPDFLPAFEPLMEMARVLAREDPDAAIELLRELELANPTLAPIRDLREDLERTRL